MNATITVYDPSTTSEPLHQLWESTIAATHPPYSLPPAKFHSLITTSLTRVFLANVNDKVVGFAITYLIRSGSQWNKALAYHKGALAALVVDHQHRNTGIGSALHARALEYLNTKVKASFQYASPTPDKSSIQLGSTFPRIFPGIPEGPGFDEAKAWFERRGWMFGDKKSIDLYQPLKSGHRSDLEGMMKKALDGGFTFGEPRVEDLEGVMQKALDGGFTSGEPKDGDLEKLYQLQKDNFDSYTGWPDMFPSLVDAGRKADIHVVWNKDGEIVGATVAALVPKGGKEGPMHESLAWPITLGTISLDDSGVIAERIGSSWGIIACVGVAASTRGSGAGVAMVASATQNLIDRGADGCFIDWVDMDGFYEKCGYKKWEKAYSGAWRDVLNE